MVIHTSKSFIPYILADTPKTKSLYFCISPLRV